MNKILALANLCMPTFFFNFLAGAPTTEINSLIFKYPALKKITIRKRCPLTLFCFSISFQCVVLAPTVFLLPMIVKSKLLAQCQLCIHLG